jgi:hypothetical protein
MGGRHHNRQHNKPTTPNLMVMKTTLKESSQTGVRGAGYF